MKNYTNGISCMLKGFRRGLWMGYFNDLRLRQMRKIVEGEKQVLRDSMVLLKLKYLANEITEVEYMKESKKFRDAYATILSVEVYLDKHDNDSELESLFDLDDC